MKRLKPLFIFFVALAPVLVSSCSDDEEPVVPAVPEASVAPDCISYQAETSVYTLSESGPSASPYINTESVYEVAFDDTKTTATITINNAKFAEKMPPLNMQFKNVSVELGADGYKLRSNELIPEIADTPYPSYVITSLSADVSFAEGGYLKFTCAGRWSVSVALTVPTTVN